MFAFGLIIALGCVLWPESNSSAGTQPAPSPAATGREPIRPLPLKMELDARKVALGKALFHEPKLSRDNTISCASCHDLSRGGTDRRQYSLGLNNAEGSINAPTVFNSGFNFRQFWDGRAATLEDQIDGPVQHPAEMGATWADVVAKLRDTPQYAAAFKETYPDGVQSKNVKDAIAHFERSLITPNARFDQFLRGEQTALNSEEREGYRKFKQYGCVSCHQGVNIGGNMFETLGAMADYFAERGNVTKSDYGRFNVTGKEEDRFAFKVPSLRNVAVTAPYFHDGSAQTLEEAVAVMGKYQLGRPLSPEDIDHIAKFLRTLTGQYEGKPLQEVAR
ncbi:MAG: cytochrome-c peroxidase [Verrucomicrobiota bacterium]